MLVVVIRKEMLEQKRDALLQTLQIALTERTADGHSIGSDAYRLVHYHVHNLVSDLMKDGTL